MPEEKGFLVSSEEYNEIPFDENIVYDFGGFKDTRINNIIKQASKIIIPTLTSIVDVQATMATLKDVVEINKNIIIVINRAKNNNKAIELKEYLLDEIRKSFNNLKISIIFVRESSVLEDSLFDCEFVETKAGNNRFKRHIYRNAIEDMINLKKNLEK
jgi:MinD superfamily P-loop ATPase